MSTEKEQQILEKEQSKLKKFKISYYYLATGMEGIPQMYPEKIIEAPTKDMAVYIYHLMFMGESTIERIESIKSYGGGNYSLESFYEYLKGSDTEKYWATSIEEVQ